jgi:hypothetical protein
MVDLERLLAITEGLGNKIEANREELKASQKILWHIDLLLGRELEMDEYSRCYAIGG